MNKKIVFVSIIAATLMVSIPFVSTLNARELQNTDREIDYEALYIESREKIPEYIDISSVRLSEEELVYLKQKVDYVKDIKSEIEAVTGESMQSDDIPVLQNGVEILSIPEIQIEDNDMVAMPFGGSAGSTDGDCIELWLTARYLSGVAAYMEIMCFLFKILKHPDAGIICLEAHVLTAAAAAAWAAYYICINGESDGSSAGSEANTSPVGTSETYETSCPLCTGAVQK